MRKNPDDYDNGENGHAILIALDGENAWEYYPFNGYYFLRALYAALADHPLLELITLSDCVQRGLEALPLQKVVRSSSSPKRGKRSTRIRARRMIHTPPLGKPASIRSW